MQNPKVRSCRNVCIIPVTWFVKRSLQLSSDVTDTGRALRVTVTARCWQACRAETQMVVQHEKIPQKFPYLPIQIYRVSQEERAKLRESVPYVKLYRYNPKHLYPKLNGFRDNGK